MNGDWVLEQGNVNLIGLYFTEDIKKTVCSYMDKLIPYFSGLALYFRGILYLGIMIDKNGVPHIIEINTRPGCPEFLTILDTIDTSNLLENFYHIVLYN